MGPLLVGLPHPSTTIMRATAIVLLAVAAVKGDSEAYTLGQVAYGLPVANAYATGHPHNVGVVTGVGYGGHGVYYGKREAEAYTIGQVAYGGARGVVTGVDYGYGRVAGYGAVGNRGLGYAGYFYG